MKFWQLLWQLKMSMQIFRVSDEWHLVPLWKWTWIFLKWIHQTSWESVHTKIAAQSLRIWHKIFWIWHKIYNATPFLQCRHWWYRRTDVQCFYSKQTHLQTGNGSQKRFGRQSIYLSCKRRLCIHHRNAFLNSGIYFFKSQKHSFCCREISP